MSSNGQALISSLSSLNSLAISQCECCQKLSARIAFLETSIANIKPVDATTIIREAVKRATLEIEPLIAPGAIAALAPTIAFLRADVTAAKLESISAKVEANGASVAAGEGKAKAIKALALIAGILVTIASFELLGSRIDAVENGLLQLGNQVSQILGSLLGIKNTAERAESKAQIAQKTADLAFSEAVQADKHAGVAQTTAEAARGVATQARTTANTAQGTAERAFQYADALKPIIFNAEKIAVGAIEVAGDARDASESATNVSQEARAIAKNADGKATQAQTTATEAKGTATQAQATATEAKGTATTAKGIAEGANNKANKAEGDAAQAYVEAGKAIGIAIKADEKGGIAIDLGNQSIKISKEALGTAGKAIGDAAKAQGTANNAAAIAATGIAIAQQVADTLPGIAEIADKAEKKADEALRKPGTRYIIERTGIPGPQGKPGKDGKDGKPAKNGLPGKDGKDGKDGEMTEQDRQELLKQGTGIAILTSLVRQRLPDPITQEFLATAAQNGVCRSVAPGGCANNALKNLGNDINQNTNNGNNNLLNKINVGANAAQLAALDVINNKLGPLLPGGLSSTFGRLWQTLQIDRVLNVLILATTFHNGLMLSNNIAQTLFSAIDNVSTTVGFKWQNEKGEDAGFASITSEWTATFFKTIFGEENYTELVSAYKKANRIYQAGANVLSSVTQLTDTIMNALEYMAGQSAKVGNALRNFRVVGEKAYEVFNPQPNLKWGIFSKLRKGEESANFILQVSQVPVDLIQAGTQFNESATELTKAIKEDEGVSKGLKIEDAAKTKAKEALAKTASVSQPLTEIDLEIDE